MKKLSSFLLLGLALVGLGSCVNKDDYSYNPSYNYEQALAQYKSAFEEEFGEVPESQSFDFYQSYVGSSKKAAKTRAGSNVEVDNTIGQPTELDYDGWKSMLVSGQDNRGVGSHEYNLISPGNGMFKVYAVQYAGWYEYYKANTNGNPFNFELGLIVGDDTSNPIKLFDGLNTDKTPESDVTGAAFTANPGFGADVYVPAGETFYFYIKYTNGATTHTIYSTQNSTLLYSDLVAADKKIMVLGFEDSLPLGTQSDFNDVVLYLEGNPDLPVPEAKRFLCEDLGNIGDFDFNDVVFDVQPSAQTGKAIVTLQAAGGTLPAELWVAGQDLGEVHKLLGFESTTTMINTGKGITAEPYTVTIDVPANFDLPSFRDFKVVVTENGTTRDIVYNGDGKAPCVIITPIETSWMKETVNIKKGYPEFFGTDWTKTYDKTQLYTK